MTSQGKTEQAYISKLKYFNKLFYLVIMSKQITIIGPGLIGASLALAMKGQHLTERVHVWSRRGTTRTQASQAPWCDQVFEDPASACEGSTLIVVCTPVDTIAPLLKKIKPTLDRHTLVTDVGSTKKQICEEVESILGETGIFIGSHPMAGSEQTGMKHAQANLFKGATCIMTPLKDSPPAAIARLRQLWEALGMQVIIHSPEKHDEIVAHISHLPHLLASGLCSYLARRENNWKDFSGGGLRDTTRIAASSPTLWAGILEHNRKEIISALAGFETELHRIKSALLNENHSDLFALLKSGQKYRHEL